MYSPIQTEFILKNLQHLLDEYAEQNTKKEKETNIHLKSYANALRRACIEIGYIRYDILNSVD